MQARENGVCRGCEQETEAKRKTCYVVYPQYTLHSHTRQYKSEWEYLRINFLYLHQRFAEYCVLLGWCPVGPVLPHRVKVPFYPWLVTLLVMSHNKNVLWGRCFTLMTSLAPHLFLLGWLKLNLTFFVRSFETR